MTVFIYCNSVFYLLEKQNWFDKVLFESFEKGLKLKALDGYIDRQTDR